jgi:hypothetical protein
MASTAGALEAGWVAVDDGRFDEGRGQFEQSVSALPGAEAYDGLACALRGLGEVDAVTANEVVRVCRPGGTIGLVNWTPEGLIGEMFRIMGRYLPPPPPFATAPPCGAMNATSANCSPATT